jgi:hypothetical protein
MNNFYIKDIKMVFKIRNLDYKFVKIDSIGDGSCMFHSILQCFNKTYIDSSDDGKRKIVQQFRKDLSNILDEKVGSELCYDQLSRGQLKVIAQSVPEVSLKNMKRSLASNEWGDVRFLELISNVLNINIFVIFSETGDIYHSGDSDIYIKNRDSIIIYNSSNVHFDSVGLVSKSRLRTLFSYEEDVIKKLRSKLYKGN